MNTESNDRGARRFAVGAIAAIVLGASGCSLNEFISQQGSIDYKSAGKLPALDVPPDLVNPRGDGRFTVPEAAQRERTFSGYESARASQRPVGEVSVLPLAEGMKIERAGTQRWLVVNQPPEKLWPVVREFWQELGFLIQTELPEAGIMETDWAENRAKLPQDIIRRSLGRLVDQVYSTGERDKFRTRMETRAGATEIFISHRGMVEVYTSSLRDNTIWQPRASDTELEAEFLSRLMVKLGVDQERAKNMIAGAAAAPAAPQLISAPGGGEALAVAEPFDRAWRRVGLALDRGGFTVEDRDRSQGLYFVRYIDPEVDSASGAKPGFFARLFSFGRSSKKEQTQQYRVIVAESGASTRVSVAGKDGKSLESADDRASGRKILGLLREQLVQ
ncbi:MAG: outer membrane protein assembly factor BamC [Burkholderiaceae bacterium]|nr:outer membrane protein assembly factor BamC [Burkholderiaceae bacterium]